MTPHDFLKNALEPALLLLPQKMSTNPARAMVIAICLQESQLKDRKQIGGPARSYAQFEKGGGVVGVLNHYASRQHARIVLSRLDYSEDSGPDACFIAIEHNDILCAAFSRLLLYTLPELMPVKGDPDHGWHCYQKAWRPGKPHRSTWNANFAEAWQTVEGA